MASTYIADSNVYISAANDPSFRERFEAFIFANGPLEVSSVTVAEVLIGMRDHARHARAVQALVAGTILSAPSPEDWIVAGSTVARLGGDAVTKGRSFWNDALLASRCASVGATLVTTNTADFRQLARYIPVKVVAPFP